MESFKETSPLLLEKGRSITLDDAMSTVIRCQLGTLWVTQNNDIRDVVLEPGGQFRPDRSGPVVVYALATSRVALASPSRKTPRWKQAMSDLLRRLVASVASRHPAIE